MPDIATEDWSEVDDHNRQLQPDGFPDGAPFYLSETGRMMKGAVKRFWDRSNPVYETTGSADAYVVTPEADIVAINLYEVIRVRIHAANTTTTPTFQLSKTNPRMIVKKDTSGSAALAAGDLVAGQDHEFWYDGTNWVLSNPGTGLAGIVAGPASAVNNNFAAFDGTTGKLIKDSGFNASSFTTPSYVDSRYVATRTALKAITAGLYTAIYLRESRREGWFEWNSSNLSAEVTADTQEGLYVAPSSDATGASGAWVRVVENEIYFADWWGVAGDGTTDDTTAAQAAITSGVATLCWPASTMAIATAGGLTGVSSQTWRGTYGVTTFKLTTTPTDDLLVFASKSNFVIEDIVFDWNNQTAGSTSSCISMNSCSNYAIRRCRLPNIGAFGIADTGGLDYEISGNYIEKNTADGTFTNEAINAGSAARASLRGKIVGNTCLRAGIDVDFANGLIAENDIRDVKFGGLITLNPSTNCYGNRVIGNYCSGGSGTDVNATHPCGIENWSDNTTISGNVCYNNSGDGIHNGGSYCTVTANICYDNGTTAGSGIKSRYSTSSKTADYSTVSGNTCFDSGVGTQRYGYEESSSSLTGVVVGDNNFANNNLGDISVLSSSTLYNDKGTWTPTITFGGASTGITYSLQSATYTRRGNEITVNGRVTLSSKGTATGYAAIGGLPFSPATANRGAANIGYTASLQTLTGPLICAVNTGQIDLRQWNASAVANVTDANFQNTTDIIFSATYLA